MNKSRGGRKPLNWILLKLHLANSTAAKEVSTKDQQQYLERKDKACKRTGKPIRNQMPSKDINSENLIGDKSTLEKPGDANANTGLPNQMIKTEGVSSIPPQNALENCEGIGQSYGTDKNSGQKESGRPIGWYSARRSYRSVAYRTWKVGCARQLLASAASDYSLPITQLTHNSLSADIHRDNKAGSSSAIHWNRCFSSQDNSLPSLTMAQQPFDHPPVCNGLTKSVCYSDQQLPTNAIDCYSAQDYCQFKTLKSVGRCSTSTDDDEDERESNSPTINCRRHDLDDSVKSVMKSFQDLRNSTSLPRPHTASGLKKLASTGSNRLSRRKARTNSGDANAFYQCNQSSFEAENGLPHKRSSSTGSAQLYAVTGKPPLPPMPAHLKNPHPPPPTTNIINHSSEGKAKHFIKNLLNQGLALTSPSRHRRQQDQKERELSKLITSSSCGGVPSVIIHSPGRPDGGGHFSPPARLYAPFNRLDYNHKPTPLHRTTTVPLQNGDCISPPFHFQNGFDADFKQKEFARRDSLKELGESLPPRPKGLEANGVRSSSASPHVFRNWDEAYQHLKKELDTIRARDVAILNNLQRVEHDMRGVGPAPLGVSPIVEVAPRLEDLQSPPSPPTYSNNNNIIQNGHTNGDTTSDNNSNNKNANIFPSFFNLKFQGGGREMEVSEAL